MTDRSSGTTYQRGPHRVVIERVLAPGCREVMSSLTSRADAAWRAASEGHHLRARPRTQGFVVRRQLVEVDPDPRTPISGASRSGDDESS
jgi:hypothetical protein